MTTWKEIKARVDAMSLKEKLIRRRDTSPNTKKGKMSLDVSESSYTAIKALTELTNTSLSELVSELCRGARLTVVFDESVQGRLGGLRERRERVLELLQRTMVSDNPQENVQILDQLEIRDSNLRWSGGINPARLAENWIYDIDNPRCLTGYPIGSIYNHSLWPKITVDRKYENALRGRICLSGSVKSSLPEEFLDQLKLYAIEENEFINSLRIGVDYTVSPR
ncbi:hypothetical protein SIPHO075v1_p0040 [Vibrio phage PS65A.1]|nr:hypothetical protein SIPHO075v1_p0040 [Vibrio phage PS65A.1]